MTKNTLTFEIPRKLQDKRMDAATFVLIREKNAEISHFSRTEIGDLIRAKKIFLNGKSTKPSTPVSFRDTISFAPDIFTVTPRKKEERQVEIEILFENADIAVLNKPGNIKMHAGGTRNTVTVADWIIEKFPQCSEVGDAQRPGIVHRLDEETSGVVVVAKNEKSYTELRRLFHDREVEKKYVALVYGHLKETEGSIDFPLTRFSGEMKRKAVTEALASSSLPGTTRQALTHYRVVQRYHEYDLVIALPKTGRTHQIRVHLSALGHPIVGDKLYAFKPAKRGEFLFPSRQLLHAFSLSFTLFGQKYSFFAPLPQDFQKALSDIDGTSELGYDDEALKSLLPE